MACFYFGFVLALLELTKGQELLGRPTGFLDSTAETAEVSYVSTDQSRRGPQHAASRRRFGPLWIRRWEPTELHEGFATLSDSVQESCKQASQVAGAETNPRQAVAAVSKGVEGLLPGAKASVSSGYWSLGQGIRGRTDRQQAGGSLSAGYGQWLGLWRCGAHADSRVFASRRGCVGKPCWDSYLPAEAPYARCHASPGITGRTRASRQCSRCQPACQSSATHYCHSQTGNTHGTPRSVPRQTAPVQSLAGASALHAQASPDVLLPQTAHVQYANPVLASVDPYMPSPSQALTLRGPHSVSPDQRSASRPKHSTSVKESSKPAKPANHVESHSQQAELARQAQLQAKRDLLLANQQVRLDAAGVGMRVPGRPPGLGAILLNDEEEDLPEGTGSGGAQELGKME